MSFVVKNRILPADSRDLGQCLGLPEMPQFHHSGNDNCDHGRGRRDRQRHVPVGQSHIRVQPLQPGLDDYDPDAEEQAHREGHESDKETD